MKWLDYLMCLSHKNFNIKIIQMHEQKAQSVGGSSTVSL
jgi:hypothetical protein